MAAPKTLREPLLSTDEARARRLEEACYFIHDAMDGVMRAHPRHTKFARLAYSLDLALVPWLPLVALAYLAVTIFEEPLWCVRARQAGHGELCTSPLYPSFQIPILPLPLNLAAEAACLGVLSIDALLLLVSQGAAAFFGSARQRSVVALLLLAIADLVYAYTTPTEWWRAAPYIRAALMVAHSPAVQQELAVGRRIVPHFAAVAALIVIFVAFAAWTATLLFLPSSPEGEILPDFIEASWQLFILLTTANYPDVMMPAYTSNRLAALFFIAFVCVGTFFLMNYQLAVVYSSYSAEEKALRAEAVARRERSLDAAFERLDWERKGALSRERISLVLDELPRSSALGSALQPAAVTPAPARAPLAASLAVQRALLFATMDASGDNEIQPEEFSNLCAILHLRFERADRRSLVERCDRTGERYERWRLATLAAVLSSPAFDYAVDALIVASVAAFALEPALRQEDVRAAALSPVQATLTVVFALEVLAKGAVLPWREFWRRRRNRFDVAVTLATALVTLLVVLPNGFDNQAAIRAVLSLRLLRLLRLLAHVRAFARTFATLLKASPAALKLLKTVGIHVFFFAVLGNQLFGGVITQDRSGAVITREQADALAASAFGQADYYANSFNDLLSGGVTLFELMVVNNWFVIVDGYSTVLGRPARLFFVLHYWLGVVVALNIIVAFVIDTYTSLESTSEAALDDDVLTFDAARVSGTDTGVSGEYEVSIAQLPFTPDDDRGQLLAKLFAARPVDRAVPPPSLARGGNSLSDLLAKTFLVRGGGEGARRQTAPATTHPTR